MRKQPQLSGASCQGPDAEGEGLRVGCVGSRSGRARCHICLSNQVDGVQIAEMGRSLWERQLCFDVSRLRRCLLDIQVQRTAGRQESRLERQLCGCLCIDVVGSL